MAQRKSKNRDGMNTDDGTEPHPRIEFDGEGVELSDSVYRQRYHDLRSVFKLLVSRLINEEYTDVSGEDILQDKTLALRGEYGESELADDARAYAIELMAEYFGVSEDELEAFIDRDKPIRFNFNPEEAKEDLRDFLAPLTPLYRAVIDTLFAQEIERIPGKMPEQERQRLRKDKEDALECMRESSQRAQDIQSRAVQIMAAYFDIPPLQMETAIAGSGTIERDFDFQAAEDDLIRIAAGKSVNRPWAKGGPEPELDANEPSWRYREQKAGESPKIPKVEFLDGAEYKIRTDLGDAKKKVPEVKFLSEEEAKSSGRS